jgi:hypothetical protein
MEPFGMVPLNVEEVSVSCLEALADKVHKGEIVATAIVGPGLSNNGALSSPSSSEAADFKRIEAC